MAQGLWRSGWTAGCSSARNSSISEGYAKGAMMRGDNKLVFKCVDVSARSAVAAALPPGRRKGIYMYEFSDGSFYVGKSVNMVERHAQHVHEYKHRPDFVSIEIVSAYFASVPLDTSDAELDMLETLAIGQVEKEGYNLRNILKTKRPGGSASFLMDLKGKEVRSLPWSRAASTADLPLAPLAEATPSQLKRFERLRSLPGYCGLIQTLSVYAAETMQEPANTAGLYWSASAYPKRRNAPAVCITCGLLETLVIFADGDDFHGFLNLKRPEGAIAFPGIARWRFADYGYKAVNGVLTYEFSSLRKLDRALRSSRFLDWAYRLNIECFRGAKSLVAASGNPLLMREIVAGKTGV